MKITVVVADDHQILRSGVVALLNENPGIFEVVGEADSGYNAVDLTVKNRPDVLVLDLHMPGHTTGLQVIEQVRAKRLPTRILVLTVDEHLKETAVDKLGADMYLLKHTPNPQILETITQLGLKEPYRYKDELFVLAQNKQPLYNRRMLTDREKQILGLVALGYTREQIAEILTVTAGTIGVQLNSIYKKMGVSNKMEAIALARTNKIIPH